MARKTSSEPTIAIVGAGKLGCALALSLSAAGYSVSEIVSRAGKSSRRRAQGLAKRVHSRALVLGQDAIEGGVVWVCVPDREMRNCAEELAAIGGWRGKVVLHSSGVLGSGELSALRRRGASVASVHPLMTFVARVVPSLAKVPFALEGDAAAVRVARRIVGGLRGEPFDIQLENKAMYHAWGTFVSPMLLSMLVTAERVAEAGGIPRSVARKRMLPIILQTLKNYADWGPAGAFSGPIIRGDAATLTKHLGVLRKVPEARAVYLALARAALKNLPARNKRELAKALVSGK